jgi:hypothetical protein
MSAKKTIPARDRRVTADEFLDWVCEAIERREARTLLNGPKMPQDASLGVGTVDRTSGIPGDVQCGDGGPSCQTT